MAIKDIKIGIYGDVQITSRTVGESTDYVTADSGMPLQVFHELINTWIKYNKGLKKLNDVIFEEAEFLYKNYGSTAPDVRLAALEEARRYMDDKETLKADLDDEAYNVIREK